MKKKTIKVLGQIQKDRCFEIIQALPEVAPIKVEISLWKDNASLAQRGLYWVWMTQYAGEVGLLKDEAHLFFKEKFLVNIYERDNPSYCELIDSIRKVWMAGEKKMAVSMRKAVIELTSINDADVEQFCEYLDDIDKFCMTQQIYLERRDDMYREAMGH